jgi:hypothetical protein
MRFRMGDLPLGTLSIRQRAPTSVEQIESFPPNHDYVLVASFWNDVMLANGPSATEIPNGVPLPRRPVAGPSSFCSVESIANLKANLNLQLTELRRRSDSDGGWSLGSSRYADALGPTSPRLFWDQICPSTPS